MNTMNKDLRYIALQLCTCTWIEIMTGAGVALYLLYLSSYTLAAITVAVFTPLIAFHFIMTRMSKSDDYYCNGPKCTRYPSTSKNNIAIQVNKNSY
jgi:hypothetical protein